MYCWNLLLLISASLLIVNCLLRQHKQFYHLKQSEIANYSILGHHNSRITVLKFGGQAAVTLFSSSGQTISVITDSIYQYTIPNSYFDQNMTISIISKSSQTVGCFFIQSIEISQILAISQQKFIHLRKKQTRIIQIHPRKPIKLIIQRFDGVPILVNNRCKYHQKQDCINEMSRLNSFYMKKHIHIIELDQCSNCLLLIKITTKSQEVRLRFSIEAPRTIMQGYPTASILNQDQMISFKSYTNIQLAKIIFYSGSVSIASQNITTDKFSNGLNLYRQNNTQQTFWNEPVLFTLKGSYTLNYFIIQSIQTENRSIHLIDGYPNTFIIQPKQIFICNYQNHQTNRANILLSAPSQFMQRLSIKFINKITKQHYLVRPKYFFNHSTVSQNFQLDQTQQQIQIQIHLIQGQSGYLNISADVKQQIALPLDLEYSSILHYKQLDQYIIQGIAGNIQIIITKCVECSINIFIDQQSNENTKAITFEGNSHKILYTVTQQQLYIKIQSNNYAYYSILVRRQVLSSVPTLSDRNIQFYLTQDTPQKMLIQFAPPFCDLKICQHAKYYLLQSSDVLQLASKLYCPKNLFDFDQRLKDIVYEPIDPTLQQGILSLTRQIKHRDYIGILAQINSTIIPYQVINVQQIKLYHQMRRPFFYLAMFFSTALFLSFVIFMALRKKKYGSSDGYVRVSALSSVQQL